MRSAAASAETPPAGALLVLVSAPAARAPGLAQALVEARLAACVQVLPGVRSVYRWQDRVEHDEESLLLAKTTDARFEELKTFVLAHHPYELPEIVAVPVASAHAPYLAWVFDNTR